MEGLASTANATFAMQNASHILAETVAFISENVDNASGVAKNVAEAFKDEVANVVPIVEDLTLSLKSGVLDSDETNLWHPYWTLRDQR